MTRKKYYINYDQGEDYDPLKGPVPAIYKVLKYYQICFKIDFNSQNLLFYSNVHFVHCYIRFRFKYLLSIEQVLEGQ